MTFYPLPDEFYADPKFAGLPGDAIALWVRAASWSAHQGTDGAVRADVLPLLLQQCDPQSPDMLVRRGIWTRTRTGDFQFAAWPKLASAAYVEAKRDAARERQQRFRRSNRKPSTRDKRVSNAVTDGVTNAVSHASHSSPVPLPTGERDGLRPSPRDRAAAIANCGLCDHDGYAGPQLCDHDPTAADRAARGRALVEAALQPPTHQDPT